MPFNLHEVTKESYELMDCFDSVVAAICSGFGIDHRFIFRYYHFLYGYYKDERIDTITGILKKSSSGYVRDRLIHGACQLLAYAGFEIIQLNLDRDVILPELNDRKVGLVVSDIFNCPWHPMSGKEHYGHCFLIYGDEGNECRILDPSLSRYPILLSWDIVEDLVEEFILITFTGNQEEKNGEIYPCILNECNLAHFIHDFKQCEAIRTNAFSDVSVEDKKLIIRILSDNYQRNKYLYDYLRAKGVEMNKISSLQEVFFRWEQIKNKFLRLCFIEDLLLRKKLFDEICILLDQLYTKECEKNIALAPIFADEKI